MIFLGADPDLHATGLAAVDYLGYPVWLDCAKVGKKWKQAKAVLESINAIRRRLVITDLREPVLAAVEGQEIVYSAKQGANPRDLLLLGQVAGGIVASLPAGTIIEIPTPQQWKGSRPKKIHQGHLLRRYDVEYEALRDYCRPKDGLSPWPCGEHLKKPDWKHVLDALGLALWARDRYKELERRGSAA